MSDVKYAEYARFNWTIVKGNTIAWRRDSQSPYPYVTPGICQAIQVSVNRLALRPSIYLSARDGGMEGDEVLDPLGTLVKRVFRSKCQEIQ